MCYFNEIMCLYKLYSLITVPWFLKFEFIGSRADNCIPTHPPESSYNLFVRRAVIFFLGLTMIYIYIYIYIYI